MAIDLTGKRFGRLTALRPTEERKGTSVVWECKCDCGNIVFVSARNLRFDATRSCGCLRSERMSESKRADLTGQRFGRLTAVRPTEERRYGAIVWECKCDCGNVAFVPACSLPNGNTKSCGCIAKERGEASQVDLAGMRFGRLVVVKPTEERKKGYVVWECKCDCGNTTFVLSNSLRSGNTQSCGCLWTEQTKEVSCLDLTGQRFGKLTALRPTEERKGGSVVWECKCDCGNAAFITTANLQSGRTKSCGCLRSRARPQSD